MGYVLEGRHLQSKGRTLGDGEDLLRGRRCLVLGGGGFIGVNLCHALANIGAIVQAFGRPSLWSSSVHPDVLMTRGDFSDRVALAKAVQGQEFVFHLVGGSNIDKSNHNPAAEFAAGLLNTVHLLDIASAEGVRKIIFVSSGGTVYGVPQRIPIPETAPTNPISAYGINKLAIEKCLALYHHLHGLNYLVLRVANPYGRFQSPFRKQGVIAAFIHRALQGAPLEIWGTGEVTRDFIHIDDVVAALIEIVSYDGPHRCMNVGSGGGRSINQVVQALELVLGRGELTVIRKQARNVDVPVNVLDISLITSETEWRPSRAWLEGLRDTVAWMSSQQWQESPVVTVPETGG
jgi:UDP-glucose 4-epimerase